jgi:tetratricopeptide (TPR) repeat protein
MLFLILSSTGIVQAEMSEAEVQIKFSHGNDFYKQGQYDQAVQSYEDILLGGRESGSVYFNLANSYFRQGKLGKAILNYERALQLIPRDSDARFNYRYALNKIKQVEDAKEKTLIQKAIDAHVQFYTIGEMIVIILILVGLVVIFHVIQLYARNVKLFAPLISVLLFILIAIFSIGLFLKVTENKNTAIVLQDSQAKFEPRKEATTHFEVFEGSSVKVVGHESNWTKIKRFDGKLGWIENSAIEGINVQ